MTNKIHLLFWKLWESRIFQFVREMRDYFQYKHSRKIPLPQFIPIGWRYAKMGYETRLQMRMVPSPRSDERCGGARTEQMKLGLDSMNKEEFAKLQVGDIVRGKLTGLGYVITAHYGNHFIAVRTISVSNPSEWTLVQKSRITTVASDRTELSPRRIDLGEQISGETVNGNIMPPCE